MVADLNIRNQTIDDTTLLPGDGITIRWEVVNQGDSSAGSSHVGVYLRNSDTGEVLGVSSGNATVFASEFTNSLAAGAVDTNESVTFDLPDDLAPGPYQVVLLADYQQVVTEISDTNNLALRSFVVEDPGPPDLVVRNTRLSQTSYQVGDTLTAYWEVTNIGAGAAPGSSVALYLQNRDTGALLKNPDGSARRFETNSVTALDGGQTDTNESDSFVLPTDLSPGRYRLALVVDYTQSITEVLDDNNLSVVDFDLVGPPDLDIQGQAIDRTELRAGETLTAVWNVANEGAGRSPGSSVGLYIRDTDTGDPVTDSAGNLTRFASESFGTLAAGQTVFNESATVAIPADLAPGAYQLVFWADYDQQIFEEDKTDNLALLNFSVLPAAPPDVGIIDASASSDVVEAGQAISLAWSVENFGGSTSEAGYVSALIYDPAAGGYLRTPAGGFLELFREDYRALAPGARDTGESGTLQVPVLAPGSYHVVLVANLGGLEDDAEPANNLFGHPVTVTVARRPAISVSDAEVTEGGSLAFRVDLDRLAAIDITLTYTTYIGTASAAAGDYDGAVAETIVIPKGADHVIIPITTFQNTLADGDKTMSLRLDGTTYGTITDAWATGSILDDEAASINAPPAIHASPAYRFLEGDEVPLSDLVRLSDPDGATDLATVRVYDASTTGGGQWLRDGSPVSFGGATNPLTIAATDLARVSYRFGLGSNDFQIDVSDRSGATSDAPVIRLIGEAIPLTSAPDPAGTAVSDGFQDPLGDGDITAAADADGYFVIRPYHYYDTTRAGFHQGVDWAVGTSMGPDDVGEDVFAVSNGRVIKVLPGDNAGYGNSVIIQHFLADGSHGGSVTSLYSHLDSIDVHQGQLVRRGQKIGELGASGTQDPHLHFEIRADSSLILPRAYTTVEDGQGRLDPLAFIAANRSLDTTPGPENQTPVIRMNDTIQTLADSDVPLNLIMQVTDPDGAADLNSITLWDANAGTDGGYFTRDGARVQSGTTFGFGAFDSLGYQAGPNSGSNQVAVTVRDAAGAEVDRDFTFRVNAPPPPDPDPAPVTASDEDLNGMLDLIAEGVGKFTDVLGSVSEIVGWGIQETGLDEYHKAFVYVEQWTVEGQWLEYFGDGRFAHIYERIDGIKVEVRPFDITSDLAVFDRILGKAATFGEVASIVLDLAGGMAPKEAFEEFAWGLTGGIPAGISELLLISALSLGDAVGGEPGFDFGRNMDNAAFLIGQVGWLNTAKDMVESVAGFVWDLEVEPGLDTYEKLLRLVPSTAEFVINGDAIIEEGNIPAARSYIEDLSDAARALMPVWFNPAVAETVWKAVSSSLGRFAGNSVHVEDSDEGPKAIYQFELDGAPVCRVTETDGHLTLQGGAASGAQISAIRELGILGNDNAQMCTIEDTSATPLSQNTIYLDLYGGDDVVEGGNSDKRIVIDAGDGRDRVVAGAGRDVIEGNDGADTLRGGARNDTLNGGAAPDLLFGDGGADLLLGGMGHDAMHGGGGADTLLGNRGSDRLFGGTGGDRMVGGAGNDLYEVESTSDEVVEYHGGGDDTIRSSISLSLAGFGGAVEHLELTGSRGLSGRGTYGANRLKGASGDDTLEGMAGADTLIGGGGADLLDGGTHGDHMSGGWGDDLYLVDDSGDTVVEDAFAGNDTVRAGVDFDLSGLAIGIETLILVGAEGLRGSGNGLDNRIDGTGSGDTLTGGAGSDTMRAGQGDDVVFGGDGRDLAWLGSGDDRFTDNGQAGADGADTVYGGWGRDTVLAQGGADLIDGEGGSDLLDGGDGADTLRGGDGADTLRGGNGNDSVHGGNGHDLTFLGLGNDVYQGNDRQGAVGADTVYAGAGDDTVLGGSGTDLLVGEAGADLLSGFHGNDVLEGRAGADTLQGGAGDDTVIGGDGRDLAWLGDGHDLFLDNAQGGETGQDTAWAGSGNDSLQGGNGNDIFHGEGGADLLHGRLGNDRLFGGDQDDRLYGGDGDDLVAGGNGRDRAYLGAGNDRWLDNAQARFGNDWVDAGAGDDTLRIGAGNDTMTGGGGADTFQFAGTAIGHDVITDFQSGIDRIGIERGLVGELTHGTLEAISETVTGGLVLHFNADSVLVLEGVAGAGDIFADMFII